MFDPMLPGRAPTRSIPNDAVSLRRVTDWINPGTLRLSIDQQVKARGFAIHPDLDRKLVSGKFFRTAQQLDHRLVVLALAGFTFDLQPRAPVLHEIAVRQLDIGRQRVRKVDECGTNREPLPIRYL